MTETVEQPETTTCLSIKAVRAELIDCLSACALAATGKMARIKPALGCVLLTAEPDHLILETTDLAVRIRRTARKIEVDAPGAVLVNCAELLEAAEYADGETVTLRLIGEQLLLNGQSFMRQMYTQRADEFPPAVNGDAGELVTFAVPLAGLRAAVDFVAHARAKEDTRYAMTGILFEGNAKAQRITVVATEGYRMAVVGVGAKVKGESPNMMIHGEAVGVMLRALGEPDGEADEVAISAGETNVRLEYEDATVWAQRQQGDFPPWSDVIPRDTEGAAKLDRQAFIAAVRAGALGASDTENKLAIEARPNFGFKFSSNSPERGPASKNYPCKVTGVSIRIGVKPGFLLDALTALEGDEVEFSWISPDRPMKLVAGAMTAVVMPTNLMD